MAKRIKLRHSILILLWGLLLSFQGRLHAQCMERDSLWNRMAFLKDSHVKPEDQLKELMPLLQGISRCPYANDSVHAQLLQRIGVQYYRQNQYTIALEYVQQSTRMINRNRVNVNFNLSHNIQNYFILIHIYEKLENLGGKSESEDSLVSLSLRYRNFDTRLAQALYPKAIRSFGAGDYYRSIEYASLCEKIGLENAKSDNKAIRENGISISLSSLHWQINSLLELRKFDTAKALLAAKLGAYQHGVFRDYLATYYNQLAEVEVRQGNKQEALRFYLKSFELNKLMGNRRNCRAVFHNIGYSIYAKDGSDLAKANFYYRKSLEYNGGRGEGERSESIENFNTLAEMGDVYSRLGLYDSSIYCFKKALQGFCNDCTETMLVSRFDSLFKGGDYLFYFNTYLLNYGNAYKSKYLKFKNQEDLDKAFQIYQDADQFLEKLKEISTEDESKLYWRNSSRSLYENALQTCYAAGDTNRAFYFLERSRSVLLSDELRSRRMMGEHEILEIAQVKKNIQRLEAGQLNQDLTAAANDRTELLGEKEKLDLLNRALFSKNPLYHQSIIDTASISLQQVKQRSGKDFAGIIEIFEGDSALYAMYISSRGATLRKVNAQQFRATKSRYIQFLSNPHLLNSEFRNFTSISEQLYQMLVGNLLMPAGRLIFSPDGDYFPLEALNMGSVNGGKYFLYDHAITYTYSLRYFLSSFEGPAQNRREFLGVAPVMFESNKNLTTLAGSDESLKSISNFFRSPELLEGEKATRSSFMNHFPNFDVIQLYTHATDSSERGEPAIYFSDSTLYLSELIADNKPATRLIVLSACETAGGKFYQGEGVFNFNRGFAAIGIPASITNLWSVNAEATYKITELFYEYLAKGIPTDVALQKAKIDFIRTANGEMKLPNYWAAAILAGKVDQFKIEGGWNWKMIVLGTGGVLLLVILVAWYIKRRRRDQA